MLSTLYSLLAQAYAVRMYLAGDNATYVLFGLV